MKRIVKIGIAVLAAIFVLGLAVSCDNGTTKKTPAPGPGAKGTNAKLTSVKFGNETATLGTPGATYGAAQAGAVTILQASANVTAVAEDTKATIKYAKVAEGAQFDASELWSDTTFEFATGDHLAIEVTAEDGKTKLYYNIGVTLSDVALSTLTVGGVDVTLPSGGTSWQTAGEGFALFDFKVDAQPAGGITIVATAADTAAVITYAKVTGSAEPTFSATATITFADEDYLYVKVTKGDNSAYYKIKINFKQTGVIKYGSPKIGYGTNPASLDIGVDGLPTVAGTPGYIDPIWDTIPEWYKIEKIYAADSGSYLDPNNNFPQTVATAKAMWDEEGLTVYVKVIDSDVSAVDAEHETDSFELFVNEDITFNGTGQQKYSNGGSQYRVASAGKRSGEGQSPAAMTALNKTSAWHTSDGYIVVMKAPWRLRSKFFNANTYRNNWEFGFELQINCAPTSGNRYAVLVWNNVAHTNYQNAQDYGIAKLVEGPATPAYPALPPTITTNPLGGTYSTGDSVSLNVDAANPIDGGQLSYQWYSATSATANGTAISGATNKTLSFSAPADTTFYYAVVTNTLGSKTATTSSGRARIFISNVPMIDKLTLAENYAVYKFDLPAGAKFGDYKQIKVDYKLDETNMAVNVRSVRLHGNYVESSFTLEGEYMFFAFDGSNAAYIYDDIGAAAITAAGATKDTWFTLTYKLNGTGDDAPKPNNSFDASHKPADTATGPFMFGIGIPGGAAGDSTPMPKTQLVKNITMVHSTDATKNVVTTAFFGFVGTGNTRLAATKREQIPDPDYRPPVEGLIPGALLGGTPDANGVVGGANGTIKINADGVTVEVRNVKTRTNLGVWYNLPTMDHPWYEYGKVKVTFNTNPIAGVYKLTAKKGKAISTDYVTDGTQYIDLVAGEKTVTYDISRALAVEGYYETVPAAIAFQVNSWGDENTDLQMEFDFTVTKIELTDWSEFTPPDPTPTTETTINVDVTGIYTGSKSGLTLVDNAPAGGKAVVTYTGSGSPYVAIPLTAAQITQINAAAGVTAPPNPKVTIIVNGSTTSDANFRIYLGNPGASSSWNRTNALPNNTGNNKLNDWANGTTELTESFANSASALPAPDSTGTTGGSVIFRLDTPNFSGTLTIESIVIKVKVPD